MTTGGDYWVTGDRTTERGVNGPSARPLSHSLRTRMVALVVAGRGRREILVSLDD